MSTPHFIVGMPRAATTWLCRCLNEHPDAVAFGETLYWGRLYEAPGEDGRYTPAQVETITSRLAIGSSLAMLIGETPGSIRGLTTEGVAALFGELRDSVDADGVTPVELFDRMSAAFGAAAHATCVIEKTPHHLNWIDRITAAYPDARFVVMLRDPYGFMLSYKHQGDRRDAKAREGFRRVYHPAACAMIWRKSMRAALDAERTLGDRVHVVRQEDLADSADDVLEGVQRFLDLDVHDLASRIPRDNTSFPEGARPELAPDDVAWMGLVAGRAIAEGGYARRRGGVFSWAFVASILRLPLWGVHMVRGLRPRTSGSLIGYLSRWVRG